MLELIKKRRSIRKFKTDIAITKEQIDTILEAAMLAPSAVNTRPWEFVAITNRDICQKIGDFFLNYKPALTATAIIVVVALPQEGRLQGYFSQDCGAATQNILLAATELGLGSCWCGVHPNKDRVDALSQLLDIQSPKIPFCVVALGVADENPFQRGFFEKEKVRYME